MSNTTVDAEQPDLNTFLPAVAVSESTADALDEIARLRGMTVSKIVRNALEGYARGYLDYLRSFDAMADGQPPEGS